MKRFSILLLSVFLGAFYAGAQDEERWDSEWYDISELYYVANDCKDEARALRQSILIDGESAKANQALIMELKTFMEEFNQLYINHAMPETMKEYANSMSEAEARLRELIKTLKENPELAAQTGMSVEALEAEIANLKGSQPELEAEAEMYMDDPLEGYSMDPASLLRRLMALAANKRAYTGVVDLGEKVFLACEGPRYLPLHYDSFDKAEVPEESVYTWCLLDETGRYLAPACFGPLIGNYVFDRNADIIILQRKEKDGSIKAGALDFKGQVRIPFLYDDVKGSFYTTDKALAMVKGEKTGWVGLDGSIILPFEFVKARRINGGWEASRDGTNCGVVTVDGEVIIPFKYAGFLDIDEDGFVQMERFDGKLDLYDQENKYVGVREKPEGF